MGEVGGGGGVQTKWFIEYILRNTGNPSEYYTLGSVLHSHIMSYNTAVFLRVRCFYLEYTFHRTLKQFYNPFV